MAEPNGGAKEIGNQQTEILSPAPRARSILLHPIPGLTPRALCCGALRALF